MCASISQKSLELGFRISSSNVQNGTLLVRISHSTFLATLTSNTMFTGTHYIVEFRHVKCRECVQVRRCGFRVRLYSLRFVYFVRGVRALMFEFSSLVFEFSSQSSALLVSRLRHRPIRRHWCSSVLLVSRLRHRPTRRHWCSSFRHNRVRY